MASKNVGSVVYKCKLKKKGYYEFIGGKYVWKEYPQRRKEDNHRRATSSKSKPNSIYQQHVDTVPYPPSEEVSGAPGSSNSKSDYIGQKREVSACWASQQDSFIRKIVQRAYPATFQCCLCNEPTEQIIRCLDCGPTAYFCKTCCDTHHSIVCLHLPQMWNPRLKCFDDCSNFFVWKRPGNHQCDSKSISRLIIIDDKGRQHYQGLETCRCQPIPVILVEYGLWAASPSSPRVAFTFDFMLTLRAMVLDAHVSLKAFCSALQECRSGLDRKKEDEYIKDIYRIIHWESVLNFMSVHHNVTHLQFADIGMPDGASCQVCPERSDKEGRRMTMDGNMNLVRREKAGYSSREPLHSSRFFLSQSDVDQFLDKEAYRIKPEEQNCSNFQAGSIIRSKNKTAKLDITGTFASICCHDFPCSIFNMRHGERMGYPIFMLQSMDNVKLLMYDLGCQLETVLRNRNIPYTVVFGVPIFHVYGHQMSCQLTYSPRRIQGAGLFDGEGTERMWSYLGKFKTITKEMCPENRTDLLVEALLNFGAKATSKMGHTLSSRLAKAYMLKESTKKAIDEDLLLLPGRTLADVERWTEAEKEAASIIHNKKPASWEEDYALKLHDFYSQCDELDEDEDAAPDEKMIRLDTSLRRLEKRQKVVQRWTRNSKAYKKHLVAGCTEQRLNKLSELRDAVIQYSFMVMIKSTYARSQSSAKRIMKQVISASGKVNKALQSYNKVAPFGERLPHRLERCEVAALDADIWQHLAPLTNDGTNVPEAMKRKLIDTSRLNQRASEEIEMATQDMKRLDRSLNRQEDKLSTEIERLDKKDSLNDFERGIQALLARRSHAVTEWKKTLTCILAITASSNSINIEELLDVVEHDSYTVPVRNELNVELKEIYKYIQVLEEINDQEDADE